MPKGYRVFKELQDLREAKASKVLWVCQVSQASKVSQAPQDYKETKEPKASRDQLDHRVLRETTVKTPQLLAPQDLKEQHPTWQGPPAHQDPKDRQGKLDPLGLWDLVELQVLQV